MYDHTPADWRRIEIKTTASASKRANKQHAKRTEVLWLNYTPPAA